MGGFTLVEIMMVTAISAFVFAGVLSAYTFLGRSLSRQVNEQSLESRTRLALYWLTQDLESASAIKIQSPGSGTSGYTMELTLSGGTIVDYAVDWNSSFTTNPPNPPGCLVRSSGGTTLVLLRSLTAITFNYYDINGTAIAAPSTSTPLSTPTLVNVDVKQVSVNFTSAAGISAVGNRSSFTVSTPRIIMKSKGFLTDPTTP
ncbi:MAG TPA: hypothetical protein VGG34_10310 [Opitutaceae bacterium]|jgi:Tfp pilus assembly protein PilW